MRDHEPTQTTWPPARVRRVALIRTDGQRFQIRPPGPTPHEIPTQPFTAPTLDPNDFGDAKDRTPTTKRQLLHLS